MTARTDPANPKPEGDATRPAPVLSLTEWLTGTTTVALPRWTLALGACVALALVFVALD